MFFTIFDLILILILFLFITFGFIMGLIQAIGSLIGVVVGSWVAGHYYQAFAAWLDPFFLGHANTAKVVAFLVLFVAVNRLIGLAFWLVNRIFNIISIIPFTKTINRVLGALLGFLEGTLVLGLGLYFIARFPFTDWLVNIIADSKVALWLIEMGNFLSPLLPQLLRAAQSFV